jgi:peptide/nickel transport system permease protein
MLSTPAKPPSGISSRRTARGSRFGMPQWLAVLLDDRKAAVGMFILAFFVLLAIFGPMIWSADPLRPDYSIPPQQAPSGAHWFGTDHLNRDVFEQVIWGGRDTLLVGFSVSVIVSFLCVAVGLTAGFFGGWIDEILSMITNVILVFPALPLIIVLAAWIQVQNDTPVIFVLSAVTWPYGARVLRSQTLSIRQKDFVLAAIVSGESGIRIVWREILPNMISLVAATSIGTVSYAIITSVALKFVGLGDSGTVSWGTILYWAQNDSAIETGGWWLYVPAGVCIVLVVTALTLVNFGLDALSNPRLRVDKLKVPRSRVAPAA